MSIVLKCAINNLTYSVIYITHAIPSLINKIFSLDIQQDMHVFLVQFDTAL